VRFALLDPRLRFWEIFVRPAFPYRFASFCAHRLITLISHDFPYERQSFYKRQRRAGQVGPPGELGEYSREPRGRVAFANQLTTPHGNAVAVSSFCWPHMSMSTSLAIHLPRHLSFHFSLVFRRSMASKPPPLGPRPAPHPLPTVQQREFEELQRQAANVIAANEPAGRVERHPDAPVPLEAEFDGDVNPATGERDGPKREPVQRWVEDEGDWSFKGRVSDF